jgi:hypothetical protein
MLSKRARIEVYLPDKNSGLYKRLRSAIENEFLFTFGGCTVIKEIKGLYLRSGNKPEHDKIALVYADMPIGMDENRGDITEYADAIREAIEEALPEQSILLAVHELYHSLK